MINLKFNWVVNSISICPFRLWVFKTLPGSGLGKWYSRISCDGDRTNSAVRVYACMVGFSTQDEARKDAEVEFDKLIERFAEQFKKAGDSPTKSSEEE